MGTVRTARDLMSPDIMTVDDEMTTDDLAQFLLEREISGAPVVDSQGHLVGVVSMTDIGRSLAEPAEFSTSNDSLFSEDAAESGPEGLSERYAHERIAVVRDVMTPTVHQVPVTASAAEVARVMVEHHVHRLVVTEGKEPVGIITSMDLLKMVAAQT